MLPFALVVVAAFLASTVAMLAVGLVVRDMVSRPVDPSARRRLEVVPAEPRYGAIDRYFVGLVEESGLSMSVGAAMLIVLAGVVLGAGIPLVLFDSLLGAAVGIVAGGLLPIIVISLIRWRRVSIMRKHMPETLQIVADAVRAGHTLEEACQFVAREVTGPLKDEFAHAHSQFQLGQAPIAVMDRMARRIPLNEFRIFATAVLVHRRAGGNLAQLTERLSHTARDRQEIRGHLMAVSAGSRLSAFGMVFGSAVGLAVLTYIEPEYLKIFFTHPLGPTLLSIAAVLQFIGVIWVWRVLKVNY